MSMPPQMREFELNDAPSDGISSIHFHPTAANQLLCSSWDKSVRLYDTKANRVMYKHDSDAAVLDACFTGTTTGASGGLDLKVRTHDFTSDGNTKELGRHEAAVSSLLYSPETNVLVSGSWDKQVKLWDTRESNPLLFSLNQPDKVYALSMAGSKFVVGCANRHIMVWDIRMIQQGGQEVQQPEQRRESSLKFQTRSVECNPDGTGYVLASIEGRVAVEFLDPRKEIQAKKYAFKCHRIKNPQTKEEMTYPVNAVAYHPKYGTFATGGSDGFVNIWDGDNKKRICQLHRYKTGISSLSFNCTGDLLAIASSYTYEYGPKEHPKDSILIRTITDAEAKPK
eukprot:CFRG4533T1